MTVLSEGVLASVSAHWEICITASTEAGGLFVKRSIPYDENMPGEAAHPFTLDLSTAHPDVPGAFCMGHPAMCAALAKAAEQAGAVYRRGVANIETIPGSPPHIAFDHDDKRTEWQPRVVIGADGRNSQARRQLGVTALADPPHNLIAGMLVEGVPAWPQDMQVIGTEDRTHFLIFPQGGDRVRLYLCYDFADKTPYVGPTRQENLITAVSWREQSGPCHQEPCRRRASTISCRGIEDW
jgi:2-polyprenyl-6-methoxyphenol hydroxylase-like FAD-dependent oxidoreductase